MAKIDTISDIIFNTLMLYNLHASGVPNDPDLLANIAASGVNARTISPEELPHKDVTFDDVIAPESIEEAGYLMLEIEDRIFDFSISAQQAAMDAGNFELAEEIDRRWSEFSRDMEDNQIFSKAETFVLGAREAMTSYEDVVRDIHKMLLSDPVSIHELRHGSGGEGITNLGRAKAGIAHYSQGQFDGLIDAVEGDLEREGLIRDASVEPAIINEFPVSSI